MEKINLIYKHMIRRGIIISIITFLTFSCEKENTDNNKMDTITFNGITKTTINGELISQDASDWKLQESWTDKETSLFIEKKDNSCIPENNNYSIISYPNPCDGIFNLHISKPDGCRLAFRIVDKNFNVLLSQDSVFSTSLGINLNDSGISNDTVRIYYKFFGSDCELKGHGDIKIE
jgi:hypothetical protein